MTSGRQQHPSRKLRVLCLHGFRTSASILEKQIRKWNNSVLDLLDLTFLDGPFPCGGKSDVEGIFPPPYFEWFQFNKTYTEFFGIEECVKYVSDFINEHGPFDGLLGFSQGAILSAAFVGLQQNGHACTHHPALRFVIIISGAMFKTEQLMKCCYPEQIKCQSVHLIGANDWFKPYNEEVLEIFENPVVIRHEAKHMVPKLGEGDVIMMRNFLLDILEGSQQIVHSAVAVAGEKLEEHLSGIQVMA